MNRLSSSVNPYLLQHATNPVHWQPWDDQALAEARARDVPILLSIGYAACHWCHVMEHESFSGPAVAQVMNENFVCIKVDREERPDLDKIYQEAHYLLSSSTGGWPLTVFLAPDLVPFFTGTYFPPVQRGSMMAFSAVLERVSRAWREHKQAILSQNQIVRESLAKLDQSGCSDATEIPAIEVVDDCAERLAKMFDLDHGGLGGAPKFAQVPALMFCLSRVAGGAGDPMRSGLQATLEAMAAGGLHDHLEGGFFRYCIDPLWDLPHFEKMLSDNAQLLDLYAHAAIVYQEQRYADIARLTASWLLAEMRSPEGAFYSSLDADSEGGEGLYYVWQREEVRALLTGPEDSLVEARYALDEPANFGPAHHLRLASGNCWQQPSPAVLAALAKLRGARAKRPRPALDNKVTVANCGLAAAALARAGLRLNEPRWIAAARAALAFVARRMWVEGALRTAWCAERCSDAHAFLDDHAHLLDARIALLGDCCSGQEVRAALAAAELMLAEFGGEGKALRFVRDRAPKVLRTLRVAEDGALPAGNAVAARGLQQLGWLSGSEKFLHTATTILRAFGPILSDGGGIHCPGLLEARARLAQPPPQVLITGPDAADWQRELGRTAPLGTMLLAPVAGDRDLPAPLVKPAPSKGGQAFVCRAERCGRALASIDELRAEIRAGQGGEGA